MCACARARMCGKSFMPQAVITSAEQADKHIAVFKSALVDSPSPSPPLGDLSRSSS